MFSRKVQIAWKKFQSLNKQPKLALTFVVLLLFIVTVHEKFTTESVHTTNTHPTGEGITVPEPDRKFDVPDFLKPELAKALPPEYEDGLLKVQGIFK